LLAAEQLLIASRKKNKMLFMITDGVFDSNKNDEVIERLSKRGVLTIMTLIMDDREAEYYADRGMEEKSWRHGAEVFGRIKTAKDLLPFAKSVVTGAIKKRGR
jgi:serine/threonine-protein kinase RIO1